MSGIVTAVRCHYCSRQVPAWRTHRLGDHAQLICDDCLDWHNKAIDLLAGRAMPGCQACGATCEFLRNSELSGEIRMYVVPKDGIYQVLCQSCCGPYVAKRSDLYRETPFGHANNL